MPPEQDEKTRSTNRETRLVVLAAARLVIIRAVVYHVASLGEISVPVMRAGLFHAHAERATHASLTETAATNSSQER